MFWCGSEGPEVGKHGEYLQDESHGNGSDTTKLGGAGFVAAYGLDGGWPVLLGSLLRYPSNGKALAWNGWKQ